MESLAFVSRKGTVIGEFEKQARFSNGGVTDNKKLKQVIVFVAHDVFFSAFNSKTSSSLHGKQEKLSDNLRERSSLQSATQIRDSKQPAVYFRKRFRRPAGMLPPAPKEKQIITGTPCSISSDHVVDETQNVKQPRGRRFEGPLWFNYGCGLSREPGANPRRGIAILRVKVTNSVDPRLCTAPSASPGTASHDATDAVTIRVETIVRPDEKQEQRLEHVELGRRKRAASREKAPVIAVWICHRTASFVPPNLQNHSKSLICLIQYFS
ncbi:hypothetical protein KIW84_022905 [Lathyrus oleraceus]|uniref:Uncharacterized protein n=1 Tax=Pisum sativum TaxID=3888 RepID=A0A9D4YG11_PEA|nr:hypothetical protein KIW84_022905 [Pisum sativum]